MLLHEHTKQIMDSVYSKNCLKWPFKKKTKIGFQDQLSLNAGQKGAFCNSFNLH